MCAVLTTPRIETERLVLRAPALHDAWRIADLINDQDIARMTTSIRHPYSLADAEEFLSEAVGADPARDRHFVIEHKDFGVIGGCGLHQHDGRYPEMGYWLGRTFWGRGLATEAVRAALNWALRDWGKRAVLAGHFTDNPASGRVLDKAGFLYTGDVQNRYSLARGDVAPTRMMVWLA